MFPLVLVFSAMIGDPAADDLKDYHTAAGQAGRDAEAHVKLALWCEAHGLKAERLKHLAIAVLTDPSHATARGLMGLVAYRGKWQRPDAVAEQVKSDEATAAALAEYGARRARTPNNADAQWKLALWCEEKGLRAEAMAHLAAVVRLDPAREAAWKRMGYKKHDGRWMTEGQVAAERAEAEAQKHANKFWLPLLAKWRGWLGEKARRAEAERVLGEITDPRAVPAVWTTFATGTAAQQDVAVRVLGQIDSPDSSLRLAAMAVFGRSAEVRRSATETLKRRDPREFVGFLVDLVRDPIKHEVRPVGGPGSPGALSVQGKRLNVERLYSPPPMPSVVLPPGLPYSYETDANGLPALSVSLGVSETMKTKAEAAAAVQSLQDNLGQIAAVSNRGDFGIAGAQLAKVLRQKQQDSPLPGELAALKGGPQTPVRVARERQLQIPIGEMMLEAQMSAAVAQQQLRSDVAAVEGYNSGVRESNARVLPVLTTVTGRDLGEDQGAWSRWWTDEQGYAVAQSYEQPAPTVVEDVPLAFVPQTTPVLVDGPVVAVRQHSCFGAGTPVHTIAGPRPIEAIRAGDQVLAQDPTSGALSYHPIIGVFHNPPNRTLKVALGNEAVVATGIHRFWRAGKGWTMARDLKPGDVVRILGGTATVTSVEDDRAQPVFNLQVADAESFFVGEQGALVHDNSLVRPTPEPFDAPPGLAAIASRAK
jgi:hypothetical protein